MKLYFYFLDTMKMGIREEECEVVEEQKTYSIVGDRPKGYLGNTVNKSAIGMPCVVLQSYVILTEKNPKRAAEALTLVCKDDIRRAERAIRGEQEKIRRIQNTIENIEKWRSENAEK